MSGPPLKPTNRGSRRAKKSGGKPSLFRRFILWLFHGGYRPALYGGRSPKREWIYGPSPSGARCGGKMGECPNPAVETVTFTIRGNPKHPQTETESENMCAEHRAQVREVLEHTLSRRALLLRRHGVR